MEKTEHCMYVKLSFRIWPVCGCIGVDFRKYILFECCNIF